jgi:hypothetical protein
MMYGRIMLACSWWVRWSVPSRAKYRKAVNCASMRFNQDEFVGVVGPAVVLGQDLTQVTGSVRDGAAADLAPRNRKMGNGHREAAGTWIARRSDLAMCCMHAARQMSATAARFELAQQAALA